MKAVLLPSDVPESDRILEKTNMEKSIFNFDGEKVELEVLPCTLKACLTKHTNVIIDGKYCRIGDLQANELIASPSGDVKIIEVKHEISPCIRIELDNGAVVEGTLDHKVWTNRGWVELQNLTDNDEVVCES
jgi:intein/homing endonuclease